MFFRSKRPPYVFSTHSLSCSPVLQIPISQLSLNSQIHLHSLSRTRAFFCSLSLSLTCVSICLRSSALSVTHSLGSNEMIGRLNSQFSGQIAMLQIPPGYSFQPTDEDLLRSYLHPKVYGKPLPCPVAVKEIDLYQMSPDDIWNKFMEGPPSGNSDLFSFTKLRSTGEQSRFDRTVYGGGTWKQESGRELVYSNDTNRTIIGSRRRFSFMSGEQQRRSGWVMHEYRLLPPDPSSYALCRLHKNRANSHKKKAQPQPQLQDHEQSEIERSEAQSHLQPQLQDTQDEIERNVAWFQSQHHEQDEIERNVALVQSQHQDIFGTGMYGAQSRLQTQDEIERNVAWFQSQHHEQDEIERNVALVQSQHQDIFGTEMYGAQSRLQTQVQNHPTNLVFPSNFCQPFLSTTKSAHEQDEIERNEALVQSQNQDIFGTEISGAQSQTQPPPQFDDSWIGCVVFKRPNRHQHANHGF